MVKLTDLHPGPPAKCHNQSCLACLSLCGDFVPLLAEVVINVGTVTTASTTGNLLVCLAPVWDVAHPESQQSSAQSKEPPSSLGDTEIHTNNVSEAKCETRNAA